MINIQGVKLVTGERKNIVIENSQIKQISEKPIQGGEMIHVPENVYVSPGWIDLHTHAFPKFQPYCSHPDEIGYKTGVTTVVDAGSSGADTIHELYDIANECITNVLAFINISRIGLEVRNELANLDDISFEGINEACKKYPDFIVGMKARMSASVVGSNGIKPLESAREFSTRLHKPLMVHIGSAPPSLEDIVSLLKKGDIITHCFHEKEGNNIFYDGGILKPAVEAAMNRGVYLDVGHGTSSFSFHMARKAKEMDVFFDSISTDIYDQNRKYGPVYNMATTLTKFLALGYDLKEVIRSVTEVPANILHKPILGKLAPGKVADLTFFTIEQAETTLIDSVGNILVSPVRIKPYAVIIGGEYYECE
ncbi:amidohydrolase/deacetylase family metallohydrolase [Virgibacillus soli]|uniref:amidohydrolase/deacetylase family metallohydrolase n=1 Tax=Paracerasibacillus soli TaxID=480284 RepID=UPI0035F09D17